MSSSFIEALSEQNQARVANILESCLFALEHGERLSPTELLEAHPDLAEPLGKCLTTLMSLHAAVHGDTNPATAGDALQPGMQLGDFVLEEQIGRGGMGVVYRAKQLSLDRQVAIKLLPNSHLLSPKQLRRFTLESRAVAQLQHAHIVPVYAVGQQNNVHYFAMQLISGCSLEKIDYRTWSANGYKQLISTAIELCDAMAHAHDSGIIHRDIKPGNLLLDEQGKVWITDFGLALCKSDTRLTMSGDLIGTMNYMSPEQSRGQPVDERTDIYSLGATLYELITGKAAFAGQVRADVFHAIEQAEPIPPRRISPQCPYDLETIVLKAMSKSRDDRYARASDMRDDLQRLLRGEPLLGRRPNLWQRAWRWTQRHQGLVGVAALGMFATCASITVGAAQVLLTRNALLASRIESQQHLATAEDNYWQGRNLVQRWNKEVVSKLGDLPGAETLQARMLSDTIDYYQAFLAKAQQPSSNNEPSNSNPSSSNPSNRKDGASKTTALDPALAKDVAAARLGLAAALDARGQTDQAIAAYEKAIEELRVLSPPDATVQSKLAIAENDLAVVLLREGEPMRAQERLKDALRQLSSARPTSDDVRAAIEANLARTYQALGDTPSQLAALEAAERIYRAAIPQAVLDNERQALQSELAAVLDLRALTLADRDRGAAMQLSRQAIEFHQACCQHAFTPIDWQRRMAASQHNYAVLLLESGEVDAARSAFQQAIATKLSIGQRTGLRPGTGADAATSFLALGRLESRQQQTATAIRCFDQAIAAVKHDLASQPNVENRLLLAESLGSRFRLSENAEIRLELDQLLIELKQSALTDHQQEIVHKLEDLVGSFVPQSILK